MITMQGHMLTMGHHLKIVRLVIQRIAVDMMNDLFRCELTTNQLFNDMTMLKYFRIGRDSYHRVALCRNVISTFPISGIISSPLFGPARTRAESLVHVFCFEFLATLFTGYYFRLRRCLSSTVWRAVTAAFYFPVRHFKGSSACRASEFATIGFVIALTRTVKAHSLFYVPASRLKRLSAMLACSGNSGMFSRHQSFLSGVSCGMLTHRRSLSISHIHHNFIMFAGFNSIGSGDYRLTAAELKRLAKR